MIACECGCGTELDPAPYKGRVRRFAHGHNRRRPMAERFWEKVERLGPDECWRWQGGHNPKGYGVAWTGRRLEGAHRVAYRLAVGPVPDGLDVDHVAKRGCVHRDCCNPAHLEAVLHRENLARSSAVAEAWAESKGRRWA